MISRAVNLFTACALLSSCATQQVLVTDTRSFVAAGRVAGARASDFFRTARERQLAANVLLVASDSSCEWGSVIYIRSDYRAGDSLCVSGAEARGAIRYPLRPITADTAAPAAQLVAALGAYIGELAKLDTPHVPEFQQAVDDVQSRLTRLQTALAGIGQLNAPVATAVSDGLKNAGNRYNDPATAIAGLLDFFAGLARTDAEAAKIRAYIAQHGGAFDNAIDALVLTMTAWNEGVVETSAQVARDALVKGTNRTLSRTEDFDKRRAALSQLVVTLDQQGQAAEAFADTAALLADLKTQHTALRQFAAGRYTPADRSRIAKVQEEQVWQVFDRLGGIGAAVGGVL